MSVFLNSSVKGFFTKIKDFSKSTIIDINLIFFLAWSHSDVQGTQSVLVFMAVHVAVCFLFNSMLIVFVLDCITIGSVIIINTSTVLNLRQENFSSPRLR